MIIDPNNTNCLIAATDVGVFYKDENTDSWQALPNGMPMVPVTDLSFHSEINKLVAATYGRSMYELEFTVSISDKKLESSEITLSPNPAADYVQISFQNNQESYVIEIVDIQGKVLYSKTHDKQTVLIHLTHLLFKPGMYLVNVKQNEYSFTQKLIIQ